MGWVLNCRVLDVKGKCGEQINESCLVLWKWRRDQKNGKRRPGRVPGVKRCGWCFTMSGRRIARNFFTGGPDQKWTSITGGGRMAS
eukprot:jgi/Botrbrau1/22293/Bobra.0138s0045.1